jgi:hypothetical protein
MSKVVRHEFVGSWLWFWALCVTVVFIPIALLYLIGGTIRVETEMTDPEAFVAAYRAGKGRIGA